MEKFHKITDIYCEEMSYLEYLRSAAIHGRYSSFRQAIKQVTLKHLVAFHQEDIGQQAKRIIQEEVDRREKRLIYLESHHADIYKIEKE